RPNERLQGAELSPRTAAWSSRTAQKSIHYTQVAKSFLGRPRVHATASDACEYTRCQNRAGIAKKHQSPRAQPTEQAFGRLRSRGNADQAGLRCGQDPGMLELMLAGSTRGQHATVQGVARVGAVLTWLGIVSCTSAAETLPADLSDSTLAMDVSDR